MKTTSSRAALRFFLVFFLFSYANCLLAQTKTYHENVIRVKFKLAHASQLDNMSLTFSSDGVVQSGFADLDELNKSYKVQSMIRVYPPAGKYEKRHRKHQLHLWYELRFKDKANITTVLEKYSSLGIVEMAEPNYKTKRIKGKISNGFEIQNLIPNDPLFANQWHYKNTGQTGGTPGADISLDLAWDIETGDPDVVVSVHDGGVDITHEDVSGQMWINSDEIPDNNIDDDNNGYVDDYNGYNFGDGGGPIPADDHGTHVGGTIAAKTNNGIGVSGVAGGNNGVGGARLMSLSVFGAVGVDGFGPSYVYAADNGAVISQNSWGYTQPGNYEQVVLDGIDYFVANAGYDENDNFVGPLKGGVVMFAAGNANSEDDYYPGYYSSTLAVAATNHNDVKAWYSNFGDWVDVSAPGGETMVENQGVLSTTPNNTYSYFQGTSMACPHVSGVAALIVSKYKGSLTATDLRGLIEATTDPIDDIPLNEPYQGKLGTGRINAFTSLLDDEGIPPSAISNLEGVDSTQSSVTLRWTAPWDGDNLKASKYVLRYSKSPIDSNNFDSATEFTPMPNPGDSGAVDMVEVTGLQKSTLYYFAIKSQDFFNNQSEISNVAINFTTEGPEISVEPDSLFAQVDVTIDPVETKTLSIINNGLGVLDYDLGVQYRSFFSGQSLIPLKENYGNGRKGEENLKRLEQNRNIKSRKLPTKKRHSNFTDSLYYDLKEVEDDFVGLESGDAIASAVKFTAPSKFTLTHVKNLYRTQNLANPEIVLRIYSGGDGPTAGNLVLEQVLTNVSVEGEFFVDLLDYPLEFDAGEVFWIHYYCPDGIPFPQGIYYGTSTISETFYYSLDAGSTWGALEEVFPTDYFKVRALSSGSAGFITLEPSSGSVLGNDSTTIDVVFDGSKLDNGVYNANILVESNDDLNPTISVPAEFIVSGQTPQINWSTNFIEFGGVFVGGNKQEILKIKNTGYASLSIEGIDISNPSFQLVNLVDSVVLPGDSVDLTVVFSPDGEGTVTGTLTINSNDPINSSVEVVMAGSGINPPVIKANPMVSYDTLGRNEEVTKVLTIKNEGPYPLSYSLPVIAANKILNDPGVVKNDVSKINFFTEPKKGEKDNRKGHEVMLGAGTDNDFGYTWIDSDETGGPTFVWSDISSSGEEIALLLGDDENVNIDLPFSFSFYGNSYDKLYIGANGVLGFQEFESDLILNSQIPSPAAPNNIIAFYWSDLFPPDGKVYYLKQSDKVIVQFDSIPHFNTIDERLTCQVVLHYNGSIEIRYKNVSELVDVINSYTVGIENEDGSDGVQVVFNNDYLKDSLAILFVPPAPSFIVDVSEINGIILPGQEDSIEVTLGSGDLYEEDYKNDLLITSNDPVNSMLPVAYNLHVIGEFEAEITPSYLDFDSVYIGAEKGLEVEVKNTGTKVFELSGFKAKNGEFILVDSFPIEVLPTGRHNLTVKYQPSNEGLDLDSILFCFNENTDSSQVYVRGIGVAPPEIVVNPDVFNKTLLAGSSTTDTLNISNIGGSQLKYSLSGTQWVKGSSTELQSNYPSSYYEKREKGVEDDRVGRKVRFGAGNDNQSGYSWEDNSNGDGGLPYDWIEIKDIGEKLDVFNDNSVKKLLPFNFSFFGEEFDSLTINANGFLTFGPFNDFIDIPYVNFPIPTTLRPNAFIAPLWIDIEPEEGNGVFYHATSDYVVIQYDDAPHYDYPQDNLTYQAILFSDGTIKFQYKDVEAENLSELGTVGIENGDGTGGMEIVFNNTYVRNNLAVTITPPVVGVVEPGETVFVPIEFNALQLNDGYYTHDIAIKNNDPKDSLVIVPANLTVIGVPDIVTVDTVDFEDVYIHPDSNFVKTVDFVVVNEGTKALDISQFLIIWTGDIDFQINPSSPTSIPSKDSAYFNVSFDPSTMGARTALLVIQSNDPDQPNKIVALVGNGIAPPVIDFELPEILAFNLAQHEDSTVAIGVKNTGGSTLNYEGRILDEWGSLSNGEGSLSPGSGHLIDLNIYAQGLSGGNYTSTLIFESNDPFNNPVQIPIELYVNHSPLIVVGPEDKLSVDEGDTLIVNIIARDIDGSIASFVYTGIDSNVLLESSDSVANFVYTPGFDQQGDREFNIEVIDNRGDSTSIPFSVYVKNVNRSPVVQVPISDKLMAPNGQMESFSLSNHFEDPDLDSLVYSVSVSNGLSVQANLSGDTLKLTSGTIGQSLIIVEAKDLYDAVASDTFMVIVTDPNEPPVIISDIPDKTYLKTDPTEFIVLSSVFSDPDGDEMTYAANTDDQSIVMATVANGNLYLNPEEAGSTSVKIAANDGNGGIASLQFNVNVTNGNLAPELILPFKSNLNIDSKDEYHIDLALHFRDPESEDLRYNVTSSNKASIMAKVKGSKLILSPNKKGKSIIKVFAVDPQNSSANSSFSTSIGVGFIKVNNQHVKNVLGGMVEEGELIGYPNPFNMETMLHYYLEEEGFVKIEIFNSLGQMVEELYNGRQSAGYQNIKWKSLGIGHGIYTARLVTNNKVLSVRLIVE